MPAIVSDVLKDSIAEELEIKPGDEIVSIDDTKMLDMIDYNFLCKSDFITIEVKKTDGEVEVIEIEKDYDDDLGIVFESAVFDRDRKSTRLNSSHKTESRMPSSA